MRRAARAFVTLLALSLVLGACARELQGGPLGPCGDDARALGGYPELEALLPTSLGPAGRPPDRVDSGRSCSETALSTLKGRGVTELRFAGATWNDGDSEATVIAVLATPAWVPPLEAAWVEEWYERGARAGKRTDNIETSRPVIGAAGEVFRLDTINDLSFQTIVTWQEAGLTHVVIVASDVAPGKDPAAHDARIVEAVEAAAAPGP